MTNYERFLDTFLKPALIEQYWGAIATGMWVTIQIAAAVVITGISLGLLLAGLRDQTH